jgi:hypothetical protein
LLANRVQKRRLGGIADDLTANLLSALLPILKHMRV